MAEKVTLMIPAHNEAKNASLGKVMTQAIKWQKQDAANRFVVVINDGSTDRTSEIARKKGAEAINFPENRGKADAFIAGANFAREKGCEILVTLDADILNATPKKINDLIEKLNSPFRENPKTKPNMVVPIQIEGKYMTVPWCAGQFAIRLSALNPLFQKNRKWVDSLKGARFGLETALHSLVPRVQIVPEIVFNTAPAFRAGYHPQMRQIDRAYKFFLDRSELAREAIKLRHTSPGSAMIRIQKGKSSIYGSYSDFKRNFRPKAKQVQKRK